MKTKRIISLLLGLAIVLALLPTAALAATTSITVTMARPVLGQNLPTTATIAEDYLQITKVEWAQQSTEIAVMQNYALITVETKPGSDFEFSSSGNSATVNGDKASVFRRSKTQVQLRYTFDLAETPKAEATTAAEPTVPPANPVNVTYDTFDYRAYANVYPDVKAAYGYDAQKLWAHYVNYGKAEGRVAYAISASDNPKSGATTYKNSAAGTDYTNYDGPSTVSATYLDPLPPSSNDQAQNWHDHQLTRPQFMSNAKLVAEWHSIMDVINNKKTGFNYDLVRMTRRSALVGELSHRASDFEKIYCYENGIKRIDSTTVSDKEYQEAKTSEEYGRASQSDCIILLHWMYGWRDSSLTKQIFPTPPANPGTAGQTSTTTPTAPAKPAGPAVSLTKQNLTVNGAAKNTEIYNIDGSNYFKLRDMAALLNGTGSQFSVDFNSATSTIAVKTGAAYTLAGGELVTGTDKSSTATASKQSIEIDGKKADLTAYNIGGNNFFKLRDLGTALNFDVDYDSATSTMIVKSR